MSEPSDMSVIVDKVGNSGNVRRTMNATIIVRLLQPSRIVRLVDVSSIDEVTVSETVQRLRKEFTLEAYQIDTSQVDMARSAQAVA